MSNCKNCVRFQTCKFVEKNHEFTKQMYPMFEHLEWNNLNELFYSNAGKCQFFIDNSTDIDSLLKKIDTAKYQMNWIHNYISGKRLDPAFIIEQLNKITEDYIKALDK